MSIKNDPEFVELLLRYGFEIAETERAYQKYCAILTSLEWQNYLVPKEKSELTYRYIYKYIDRYVEKEKDDQRAFDCMQHEIEKYNESKKQESRINKLQPDDAGSLEDIAKSYETPKEIMRKTEDGEICINVNLIDFLSLKMIRNEINKELIKFNTFYILLSSQDIEISYEIFDKGKRIDMTFTFGFVHSNYLGDSIPHTLYFVVTSKDNYIKLSPYKIAKYFFDRINKIALAHAPK